MTQVESSASQATLAAISKLPGCAQKVEHIYVGKSSMPPHKNIFLDLMAKPIIFEEI
jgi:hypothetical protein